MAKIGLLIVTQPLAHLKRSIPHVLAEASSKVSETLYVCLQPTLHTHPVTQGSLLHPVILTHEVEACLTHFYHNVTDVCHKLDVRVLLSNICSSTSKYTAHTHRLQEPVSLLLCDSLGVRDAWQANKTLLVESLRCAFTSLDPNLDFHFISSNKIYHSESVGGSEKSFDSETVCTYPNVVIGGTFDRLHDGHKVLLSRSGLRADSKLTIGITDGERNKKKSLWELMEPYSRREQQVVEFLSQVKPNLVVEPVRILDAFGPTITDPDFQCIVVSQETAAGGAAVNQERVKRGYPVLDTVTIDLVDDTCHAEDEEEKVSSSSKRKRLLGTLLNPLPARSYLPANPYRVGLVGGIASGKSRMCSLLASMGATVVDCDLLGHKAYVKGTGAYSAIVEEFGVEVVGEDGEIDRRKLGPLVFNDKTKLQRLNSIVWPAIQALAEEQIKAAKSQVIVMEAAVLFEAGWDNMVHEIWTTFVSRDEAVERIVARNGLTKEAAEKRIDSQLSNEDRIQKSNVAICSQWAPDITDKQIHKAWTLLQERIIGAQTKL